MSVRINYSKDGTKMWTGNINDLRVFSHSQDDLNRFDAEPFNQSGVTNSNMGPDTDDRYLIWNFPAPVTVTGFAQMCSAGVGVQGGYFQISDDTQDSALPGVLGTWTTVHNISTYPDNTYSYQDLTTPTSSRWFRWDKTTQWWVTAYAFHIFGYYDAPVFEICDQAGIVITDPTFLDFSTAYSNANWTESKIFKIKNTDIVDHTYTVTVDQQQYSDVPFITDHFKLSDGTVSDVTSLTTVNIPAGGSFSVDITLTGTIDEIDNPQGGKYYPKVTVAEAS